MSETNDAFARSIALEKALAFHSYESTDPSDSEVLATAERFHAFLTGENAPKPEPTKTTFKLPRIGDGFLYFRFGASPILYRADTSYGAMAGGVDRINTTYETAWKRLPVEHSKGTRHAIRMRSSVVEITPATAADVIRSNVEQVEFR